MSEERSTLGDVHSAMDDIHPAAKPFLVFGRPAVKRSFIWLLVIGIIICVVLGYFHPQKHPLPIEENIPFSWALFGLLVFSFVMFVTPMIRTALARPETYYGEGGLSDPDVSTDPKAAGDVHHD